MLVTVITKQLYALELHLFSFYTAFVGKMMKTMKDQQQNEKET